MRAVTRMRGRAVRGPGRLRHPGALLAIAKRGVEYNDFLIFHDMTGVAAMLFPGFDTLDSVVKNKKPHRQFWQWGLEIVTPTQCPTAVLLSSRSVFSSSRRFKILLTSGNNTGFQP